MKVTAQTQTVPSTREQELAVIGETFLGHGITIPDMRVLAAREPLYAEMADALDAPAAGVLASRARELGEQHRAAGIAPFGDPDFVYWDEGSAALLAALGITSPATEDNHPEREAIVSAYCDALGGEVRQARVPLVTPERRALYEALQEAAVREETAGRRLQLLPEPAGGSQ